MKKKIAGIICAIASVAVIASCGSSTSPAQSAINSSASALADIMDFVFDNCDDFPCDCPGGGTIDFDGDTYTANGCQSDNGESFTGTVTLNDDDSITVNFPVFGQCTAVSGTVSGIPEDNCSGTLTGACADSSVTCSMSTDCEKCNI